MAPPLPDWRVPRRATLSNSMFALRSSAFGAKSTPDWDRRCTVVAALHPDRRCTLAAQLHPAQP